MLDQDFMNACESRYVIHRINVESLITKHFKNERHNGVTFEIKQDSFPLVFDVKSGLVWQCANEVNEQLLIGKWTSYTAVYLDMLCNRGVIRPGIYHVVG